MADTRKECCKNPENLENKTNEFSIRSDVGVLVCKVCGCRHFEVSVDPIHLGIKGANLG